MREIFYCLGFCLEHDETMSQAIVSWRIQNALYRHREIDLHEIEECV